MSSEEDSNWPLVWLTRDNRNNKKKMMVFFFFQETKSFYEQTDVDWEIICQTFCFDSTRKWTVDTRYPGCQVNNGINGDAWEWRARRKRTEISRTESRAEEVTNAKLEKRKIEFIGHVLIRSGDNGRRNRRKRGRPPRNANMRNIRDESWSKLCDTN